MTKVSYIGTGNSSTTFSDNEEERVNATEIWVMTNGKTFTSENLLNEKISRTPLAEQDDVMREATSSYSVMSELYEVPAMLLPSTSRECDEDCESCCDASEQGPLHVAISMDTDVHVPDSPKMARLFRAVTSPGMVVTPNARARMADLARQIIDALPDRIKRNSEVSTFQDEEEFSYLRGVDSMIYHASSSMSVDSPNIADDYIEMMTGDTAARNDPWVFPKQDSTHLFKICRFSGPRSAETTETSRCAQLFATNCNVSFVFSEFFIFSSRWLEDESVVFLCSLSPNIWSVSVLRRPFICLIVDKSKYVRKWYFGFRQVRWGRDDLYLEHGFGFWTHLSRGRAQGVQSSYDFQSSYSKSFSSDLYDFKTFEKL